MFKSVIVHGRQYRNFNCSFYFHNPHPLKHNPHTLHTTHVSEGNPTEEHESLVVRARGATVIGTLGDHVCKVHPLPKHVASHWRLWWSYSKTLGQIERLIIPWESILKLRSHHSEEYNVDTHQILCMHTHVIPQHTWDSIPTKLVLLEWCQSSCLLWSFENGLYFFPSPSQSTLNTSSTSSEYWEWVTAWVLDTYSCSIENSSEPLGSTWRGGEGNKGSKKDELIICFFVVCLVHFIMQILWHKKGTVQDSINIIKMNVLTGPSLHSHHPPVSVASRPPQSPVDYPTFVSLSL